jgi:dephospho-CoA kinase
LPRVLPFLVPEPRVLTVGLTGNVASGKTTVARVWQEFGATVVDADRLARRAVEPGTPGLARIVAEWGPGVLAPDGTLDRAAVREIVFRDPEARARLEAIVHPEVARFRDLELRAAQGRGERLVVADIPLLFEVGAEGDFDVVVLVDAPEEHRLQRMVRDRGLEQDAARRMIAAQMPSERKRDRAHVVIDNTGSLEELEARARAVWSDLVRQAAEGDGG